MTRSGIYSLPTCGSDEIFLHGVDLKNGTLVHNIEVGGFLTTVDLIGRIDAGVAERYRAIADIPIEELGSTGLTGNILSPRSVTYIMPGAILDSGQTIVNGYGEPLQLSEFRIKHVRDIELAFEEGRRKYAPEAPSRLSCIWLAENSSKGQGVIRSMLPQAYIASVRISYCAALLVADASWFDDYYNFPKLEYIEKYWTGTIHPTRPLPEILSEGQIQFVYSEQLAHIREFGAKLF